MQAASGSASLTMIAGSSAIAVLYTFELSVTKLAGGTYVTATGTGPDGTTSEFAKAVRVS